MTATLDERTLAALDRNHRVASAETFAASTAGAAFETRDVLCVACGFPIAAHRSDSSCAEDSRRKRPRS